MLDVFDCGSQIPGCPSAFQRIQDPAPIQSANSHRSSVKCVDMNIEDCPLEAWVPVPENSAYESLMFTNVIVICYHGLTLYASSVGDSPRRGSVQLLGLPTREVGVGFAWFCNCTMNKHL